MRGGVTDSGSSGATFAKLVLLDVGRRNVLAPFLSASVWGRR